MSAFDVVHTESLPSLASEGLTASHLQPLHSCFLCSLFVFFLESQCEEQPQSFHFIHRFVKQRFAVHSVCILMAQSRTLPKLLPSRCSQPSLHPIMWLLKLPVSRRLPITVRTWTRSQHLDVTYKAHRAGSFSSPFHLLCPSPLHVLCSSHEYCLPVPPCDGFPHPHIHFREQVVLILSPGRCWASVCSQPTLSHL